VVREGAREGVHGSPLLLHHADMGFLLSLVLASAASMPIPLRVGDQQTVSLPGLTRVACGCHGVDVKTIGNDQLLLIGLTPGRTTVLAWVGDGKRVALEVEILPAWLPKPVRPLPSRTKR
jgi:hypothetical protein